MRNFLLYFVLFGFMANAQITNLYKQDFETTGASLNTTGTPSTILNNIKDTTDFYSGSGKAWFLEAGTSPFTLTIDLPDVQRSSLTNMSGLELSFDLIMRLRASNALMRVEYSLDGGTQWLSFSPAEYRGESVNIPGGSNYLASELLYDQWRTYTELKKQPFLPTDSTFWRKEVFDVYQLFATNLAVNTIKLRMVISRPNTLTSPKSPYAGVFLDNIEINASPCSPLTPFPMPFTSQSLCAPPQGTMGVSFPKSFPLSFVTRNNSSIDSAYIEGKYNGVDTIIPIIYTPQFRFDRTLQFLNNNDSFIYRVVFVNTCGTHAYLPRTGRYFIKTVGLPNNCGSDGCEGRGVITSSSYQQSFEGVDFISTISGGFGQRGDWPLEDGKNWQLTPPENNGNTNGWCIQDVNFLPSTNAGPSGAALNIVGNQYLLFRTDISSSLAASHFTLPCVKIPHDTSLVLGFDYHIFGTGGSKLTIQVDTSTGFSNYINVAEIDGIQQSSNTEPFKKTRVNLSAFAGKVKRIRFLATSTLVNGSFIAVDNLFFDQLGADEVNLLSAERRNTICGLANSDSLALRLEAYNSTRTTLPIAYQLNGGAIVRDTILISPSNSTQQVSFALNLTNTLSVNTLKIWHEVAADAYNLDDTLELKSISGAPNNLTAPFFENFDQYTSIDSLGGWEIKVLTSSGLPHTEFWPVLSSKPFPSPVSGPKQLIGGKGKYLTIGHNNFAHNNNLTSAFKYEITSPCIDLSGISNPIFGFLIHLHQFGFDRIMELKVSTDGENYTNLQNLSVPIANSNLSANHYRSAVRSLQAYENQTIKLKIVVQTSTNAIDILGLGIDNMFVRSANETDLALLGVSNNFVGNTSVPIDVSVSNKGTSPLTANATFNLRFTPKCGGTPIDATQTATRFVNGPGTNATFSIPIANLGLSSKEYSLRIIMNTVGDNHHWNDTLYVESFGILKDTTLPYTNNFENCLDGFRREGWLQTWNIGSSSNSSSPQPGNAALVSQSDANYAFEAEYINTPRFNGIDTIEGITVSFYQNFTGDPSYGSFEMNYGSGWIKIEPSQHLNAINWHIDNQRFNQANNGLSYIQLNIPSNAPQLRFRFKHEQEIPNSTTGQWTIDDFKVTYPGQHDAELVELISKPLYYNNQTNLTDISIKNNGLQPLNVLKIEVNQQGIGQVLAPVKINLPSPLPPGRSTIVSLPNPINIQPANKVTLELISSQPNNRIDVNTTNDTLISELFFLASDSVPYCDDFEQNNTQYYSNALNEGRRTALWETATPNNGGLSGAAAGSKAMITNATANYSDLEDDAFYLPIYQVYDTSCYSLSFDHHFITEKNFDGGIVEYSVDSGNTWYPLGEEDGDTAWFNTKYVQALGVTTPGFSGNSNGYVKALKNFSLPHTGALIIRFRFASNFDVNLEGWAIDNICFEKTNKGCEVISVPEAKKEISNSIHLYPNPAEDKLNVVVTNKELKELHVYDAMGKEIHVPAEGLHTQSVVLNTKALKPGFYFMVLHAVDGTAIRKTFIRN